MWLYSKAHCKNAPTVLKHISTQQFYFHLAIINLYLTIIIIITVIELVKIVSLFT